ncbi:MAG: nucleotidyltransferase family protein [Dehalococcoidia bacterium]
MLLAAGLSTRMGSPKPLLPWDGRPLLAYQIAQLHEAGIDDVVVVTGHAGAAVAAVARAAGARVAHNPAYAEGRAGSVRVGAQAVANGRDVLVLNVDQPRTASLIATVAGARAGAITVPLFEGRRGHPAVFAARLLPELRAVSDASEGLRAVMRAHAAEVTLVPVTDDRALLDLNTPEAYARALRRFAIDYTPGSNAVT